MTVNMKRSQARQPTPVRWAIMSIRFMVPRRRIRVLSKVSFIFCIRVEDSRTSAPMASVISFNILTLALNPSTCASFCDSSSSSTLALYWPSEFGVAGLYPYPGLGALSPVPELPPPPWSPNSCDRASRWWRLLPYLDDITLHRDGVVGMKAFGRWLCSWNELAGTDGNSGRRDSRVQRSLSLRRLGLGLLSRVVRCSLTLISHCKAQIIILSNS